MPKAVTFKSKNEFQEFNKFAPLPTWEVLFTWTCNILHLLAFFYFGYFYSQEFAKKGLLVFSSNDSFISRTFNIERDHANIEWDDFVQEMLSLSGILPLYIIHTITGGLYERFLPDYWFNFATFATGFSLHIYAYGLKDVLVFITAAAILLVVSMGSRSKLITWMAAIGLFWAVREIPDIRSDYGFMLDYKFLHLISFCLNVTTEKRWVKFEDNIKSLFQYAFYWPYHTYLVLPYHIYLKMRENRQRPSFHAVLKLILRVGFAICLMEASVHLFYHKTFNWRLDYLERLPSTGLASMVFLHGQFFHVQYVVIFGVPAIFAFIDGFEHPFPPICPSRIGLYSQEWRYGDRGLYWFLRDHIFVPFAGNSQTIFII